MKCLPFVAATMLLLAPVANAQEALAIKSLGETQVASLPAGPLFWGIASFPGLEQARAAATPLSVAVEANGKGWLFTLGPKGAAMAGQVAEVGPVPTIEAKDVLLRINDASGGAGATTPVHTHPGSEAFYVLEGDVVLSTAKGEMKASAGQSMAGLDGDTPLKVTAGPKGVHALVMFLVDAKKPFSTPSKF